MLTMFVEFLPGRLDPLLVKVKCVEMARGRDGSDDAVGQGAAASATLHHHAARPQFQLVKG